MRGTSASGCGCDELFSVYCASHHAERTAANAELTIQTLRSRVAALEALLERCEGPLRIAIAVTFPDPDKNQLNQLAAEIRTALKEKK